MFFTSLTLISIMTEEVDRYIARFPPEVRERLREMRRIVHEEAPEVEEVISYGMPTFRCRGNLLHFAAYDMYIGLYPTPSAMEAFAPRLREFSTSKGAVRFSHDRPIPYQLIREMVRFRVDENRKRGKGV